MKKSKKKILIILGIIIILVAGILVYLKFNSRKMPNFSNRLSTVNLTKKDLVKSISATGTIDSKNAKSVSANLNGVEVKSVKVSVGDKVKKGDEIITFDKSDLEDALASAKENYSDTVSENSKSVSKASNNLSEARSTYNSDAKEASSNVSKAKKAYEKAKKNVNSLKNKLNKSKDMKLNEEYTKAKQTLTQKKEAYQQAKSSEKNTNKQNKSSISNALDQYDQAVSNKNKAVKEARNQVKEAQKNLDKCAVVAPISGTVTSVEVENGDTYSGGTICKIEDVSSFTVSTTIEEYDISDVKKGQKVVIKTEATDDKELQGVVSFVSPSTSSSSSSSSSGNESSNMGMSSSSSSSSSGYEVKIKVKTKEKKLRLGMTAKCSIVLDEKKDVFAVPYDAVHKNSDGTYYIKVLDTSSDNSNSSGDFSQGDFSKNMSQNTKQITVKKGIENDYYAEISGDDLSEGLKVVVDTDSSSSSSSDNSSPFSGMNRGSSSRSKSSGSGMSGGGMPAGGPGF